MSIHPLELKIVREMYEGLKKTHRQSEASDLISGLSFGFWTNLLDKRYEQNLWPRLLKVVFPYLPRSITAYKMILVNQFLEFQ
jgi:hypothetical protein